MTLIGQMTDVFHLYRRGSPVAERRAVESCFVTCVLQFVTVREPQFLVLTDWMIDALMFSGLQHLLCRPSGLKPEELL
jgi:hypothetical protein